MSGLKISVLLTCCLSLLCGLAVAFAQTADRSPAAPNSASTPITPASGNGRPDGSMSGAIPPGTVITMQNWQQYRQYMPDGMAALFAGQYFWKMPADVS